MKKLRLTAGNKPHVVEWFLYDKDVSATVVFNKKLGIGFVSSVLGFIVFKTWPELNAILTWLFGR